jgi:DNA repair exonuclease SbcCD nuclease subunit
MIRFIHTADVHIDTPFTGSGLHKDKVLARRNDLFSAFRNTLELVREHDAQALLIGGDLFEEEYLSSSSLRKMFSMLAGLAPKPVIISPGNHDPFHLGSPYSTETLPENILLFRENDISKISLPGLKVTIYGTAFINPHEYKQIWKGFRAGESDGINLILTHGAVISGDPGRSDKYLPIDEKDLIESGADYVALGHFHTGFDVLSDPFTGSLRAAYPGSPEPLAKRNTGDHGAFVVSIDPESRTTTVEKVMTQQRHYHTVELNLSGHDDEASIEAAARQLLMDDTYENDLVEMVLKGRLSRGISVQSAILQEMAEKIFSLSIKDESISDYDIESIAREDNARGKFCAMMQKMINDADEEDKRVYHEGLILGLAAFDGVEIEDIPI